MLWALSLMETLRERETPLEISYTQSATPALQVSLPVKN